MPRTFLVKRREQVGFRTKTILDISEASRSKNSNVDYTHGFRKAKTSTTLLLHKRKSDVKDSENTRKRHRSPERERISLRIDKAGRQTNSPLTLCANKRGILCDDKKVVKGYRNGGSEILRVKNNDYKNRTNLTKNRCQENGCDCQEITGKNSSRCPLPGKGFPIRRVIGNHTTDCCYPPRIPESHVRSDPAKPDCFCEQCRVPRPGIVVIPQCYCKDCRLENAACQKEKLTPRSEDGHGWRYSSNQPNPSAFGMKSISLTENGCSLSCCNPMGSQSRSSHPERGTLPYNSNTALSRCVQERRDDNIVSISPCPDYHEHKRIFYCRLCRECCGCDLPRKDILCCQSSCKQSLPGSPTSLQPDKQLTDCVCAQCRSSVERFIREKVTFSDLTTTSTNVSLSDSEDSASGCHSITSPTITAERRYSSSNMENDSVENTKEDCKCDSCKSFHPNVLPNETIEMGNPSPTLLNSLQSSNHPNLETKDGSDSTEIRKKERTTPGKTKKLKTDNKPVKQIKYDSSVVESYKKNLTSLNKSRLLANLLERRRVAELNHAFDRLRGIVPCYGNEDRTLSKIKTLRYAITYIAHLAMISENQSQDTLYDIKTEFPKLFERDPLLQKCQEHLESNSVI